MAADALDAYLADRAAGKDALLVCDSWEMADALNRRLHDTLTADGPTSTRWRAITTIRVGDLIISRHNDARIPLDAAPGVDREPEQVRNGNRWRVAGVDADDQPHRRRTAHRQGPRRLRKRLPA